VLVTVFDAEHQRASFALAHELRRAGLSVAVYPAVAKLNKQLKYAVRIGAQVAVLLGPDEQAAGQVAVKDLRTREQHTVPRDQVAEFIRDLLETPPAS